MTLSVNVSDKELKRLAKEFDCTPKDIAKAMSQYLEECATGDVTSTPENMLDLYL